METDQAGAVAGELTADFAAAWNQHDMQALGSLFHEDAAFVNVAGAYMHGRQEIERVHAAAHAGPFRHSTLIAWPDDAHSLGPDVIIAPVRSELQGDDRVTGQVRQALLTLVIERCSSHWKIIAAHNTNILAPPTDAPPA